MHFVDMATKYSKILSNKECCELYPLAANGDKIATCKLLMSVVRLVTHQATLLSKIPSRLEDCCVEGCIGVLTSIKNKCFNPKKGGWVTYTRYYINAAIFKTRERDSVIKGSQRKKIFYKIETLPVDFDVEDSYNDFENIDQQDTMQYIRFVIDTKLTPQERDIIYRYYFDGATLVEIGKTYNVSKARIGQIKEKTLAKLKRLLPNLALAD